MLHFQHLPTWLLFLRPVPAGVNATSVDITFLGSGKYKFVAPASSYHRPTAAPPAATTTTTSTSSSSSNGVMLGAILGGVAAAAIAATVLAVVLIRRRRQRQAGGGKGLVQKWETERRVGESAATVC